jgi:methionine aminopeptidase
MSVRLTAPWCILIPKRCWKVVTTKSKKNYVRLRTRQDPISDGEEETNLSDADCATKYNSAAQIAKKAMAMVATKCVDGASIADLCTFGDKLVTALTSRLFKKNKAMMKGVAFPTCVSCNEMVCHNSPFASESGSLAAGDLVRVDIGVHVDGYVAVVAHTLEVPAAADGAAAAAAAAPAAPITGSRADVILAAQTALTVAHKLMKPGATNAQITAAIKQVAEDYGVKCADPCNLQSAARPSRAYNQASSHAVCHVERAAHCPHCRHADLVPIQPGSALAHLPCRYRLWLHCPLFDRELAYRSQCTWTRRSIRSRTSACDCNVRCITDLSRHNSDCVSVLAVAWSVQETWLQVHVLAALPR